MMPSAPTQWTTRRGTRETSRSCPLALWALAVILASRPASSWGVEPILPTASDDAVAFAAENHRAMSRMMTDMEAKPTGNIDVDFVNMMEPHHRGAVEMAIAQLRYGKNPKLKRIAQEIVVEQLQQINAMRLAIGRPLLASAPVPTQLSDAGKVKQPTEQPQAAHHRKEHLER